MRLTYTFDGGADGVAITTGHTGSGDQLNTVNTPAQGGSPAAAFNQFESDWSVKGGMGALSQNSDGGGAFMGWDSTSLGTQTLSFFRMYLKRPTINANRQFARLRATGSVLSMAARFATTGEVQLLDASSTVVYTSSHAFAQDDPLRIEVRADHNATTGHLYAELFWGTNIHGVTPDETFGSLVTNQDTGANAIQFHWGMITLAAAGTNNQVAIDEVAYDTVALIGPAVSTKFVSWN